MIMTYMRNAFCFTVKKRASNLAMMGAVFMSRFFSLLPNFSLVGSFGFFQVNPIYYFLQLVVFDFFFGGYYQGWFFTYLGFSAYWLFGRVAGSRISRQVLFLPVASLAFYLLSNFGVWWYWYPHTLFGLLTCYVLGVPFYRNTLLGDLFFGGVIITLKAINRLSNHNLEQADHVNSSLG